MSTETPLQAERCPECGGDGHSWDCEPCMHGEHCGLKCIDDMCHGSHEHLDCERCGGSGRISDHEVLESLEPHDEPFGGGDYRWR